MQTTSKENHIPVLLQEVLTILEPQNNEIYVDATFGAGGYSKAILARANCNILSIDCDQNASEYFHKFSLNMQKRCQLIHENFSNISKILLDKGFKSIAGIVFDLGLSSMQIADNNRGFSFYGTEYLDMRMDQTKNLTASDIVNSFSEKKIADILFHYGGERRSRAIARCIVNFRRKEKITTVPKLIQAIKPSLKSYHDRIHFATRTFQALRIYVNSELENLAKTLQQIPDVLAKNGKAIFVTFHSLEDRIVKEYFRNMTNSEITKKKFTILTKKIIAPSRAEIIHNPRARSAKLRAIRRDE